ncbi:MAG: PBP1A family penicillin-binding protein [Spirochaetota bacterium]|nr:MAG: PBP1A family penicillin-binding protein [Spirochaetota bacterium]
MKKLRKIERILIVILLFLSIVLGTGMGIFLSSFITTDEIAKLENFKPEIPSKIYDRNGALISELFTVKREPVTFEQIPKDLTNAILAIEDISFYAHKGIHVKRVLGALIANVRTGSRSQGASTITMQLARTLFTGREKTWARKIKESWLALKIEKKYSKNEILTLYCNQIYFGHGAYGIEAASQFYFNKPIRDLTLAECALLAGLPQSPNKLSPLKNPHLARKRQELVLESMVDLGMVNANEAYDSFQDFWINFRLQMRSPSQSVFKLTENKAPHFVEYVRQRLEDLYGYDRIYTDGLKVYTSLDLSQQALAEQYLQEGLERQNKIHKYTTDKVKETLDKRILDSLDLLSIIFNLENINIGEHKNEERVLSYLNENFIAPLDMLTMLFNNETINRVIETSYTTDLKAGEFQKVEGAFIAIEPKTGYITAMVGGSTFSEDNQINRATQIHRQTGSGFKPYIYTAAIDTKLFTTASIIVDAPVVFFEGDKEWIPDNYGGLYRGKMRLRNALRRSINVITAKIVDRLGVDTVVKYASNILGITDPEEVKARFPKVYSIALGVVELSPYEQAKGFATFANNGKEVTPIAILYVLDRDGNLIDNFEAELRSEEAKKGKRQIISEQTNYIMLDMLRDVFKPGGTGYRAASENGFNRPAAGKTGTTQNWKDAWFTGFTPDLAASVWVGFDRNSISLGRGQAGGVVAAPIWAKFMRDALANKPETWYSRPKGVYAVRICRESGLLPTTKCNDSIVEYFLEGTLPTEYCYECGEEIQDKTFNVDIFKRKKDSSDNESYKRDILEIPDDYGFEEELGVINIETSEELIEEYSSEEIQPVPMEEYETITDTGIPDEEPLLLRPENTESSAKEPSIELDTESGEDSPFLVIE